MKTLQEASLTSVIRNGQAKAEFIQLKTPATICYHVVLFVTIHTPLLEIVPEVYPEWYFTGEMNDEDDNYIEDCNKFYSDADEEYITPPFSWNRGDMIKCSSIRVTDEWIDAKVDNGWRNIRVPKNNVVVLSPSTLMNQDEKTLQKYEFATTI